MEVSVWCMVYGVWYMEVYAIYSIWSVCYTEAFLWYCIGRCLWYMEVSVWYMEVFVWYMEVFVWYMEPVSVWYMEVFVLSMEVSIWYMEVSVWY